MMDIIFALVAMLVFYLIPEILRKRKTPKDYEYPEIPEPMAKGKTELPRPQSTTEPPPIMDQVNVMGPSLPPAISPPASFGWTEGGNWQGKISVPRIMNGVIFAEIIGPPRCRTPHHHQKRNH